MNFLFLLYHWSLFVTWIPMIYFILDNMTPRTDASNHYLLITAYLNDPAPCLYCKRLRAKHLLFSRSIVEFRMRLSYLINNHCYKKLYGKHRPAEQKWTFQFHTKTEIIYMYLKMYQLIYPSSFGILTRKQFIAAEL